MALRVLHPCDQSWDAMPGTARERHCAACDKSVHDVRHLDERAVRGYVRLRGSASVCVRMMVVTAAVAACGPTIGPLNVPGPTVAIPPSSENTARAADDSTKDTDKDGISDANDACPMEPGKASNDPRSNGCPQLVVVETMGALRILEQIHFAKSKSAIAKESGPTIDEMIAALKASPEITKIEIGGHASIDEPAAERLSLERANAIVARIIAAGVDPTRLVPKGYGATKPIDDNKTEDGRQRNRRVEFLILEDKESPSCPAPGATPTQ